MALLLSFELSAVQTLDKSVSLNITQALGTTETSNTNTPINITTITPNYSIEYKKRKISFNANYSLIASNNNENNTSYISHNLDLVTQFQHTPNKWSSSYSANLFQKNKSDYGVLVSASSIFNTTDLYVVNKLDTTRIFDLNNNSRISSSFAISTQGFSGKTTNKNAQLSLQHDLRKVLPSVNLSYSINRNQNLDNDDTNNIIKLTTYYTINSKLESFVTIANNSSSNDAFSDSQYSVGLNWQLTPKSFLNFDVGKFGDIKSWSLDSSVIIRRSSFSLSHKEEIAPANQNILTNISTSNSNLLSSINNDLKYIKNTALSFNHRTRRLVTSFVVSLTKEFTDLGITSDKTIISTNFNLIYSLNTLKSISYTYSRDSIETILNNQLIENSVKWTAALSRQSNYNVVLIHTQQNGDNANVNYSKNQLDFNYTLIF